MVDHIIGSSHGLRPEDLAAREAAQNETREAPGIHISGGHVVLAIYGNISGPVNIYRDAADTPLKLITPP